jgi:phosphoenolpyruvate carboxylase
MSTQHPDNVSSPSFTEEKARSFPGDIEGKYGDFEVYLNHKALTDSIIQVFLKKIKVISKNMFCSCYSAKIPRLR